MIVRRRIFNTSNVSYLSGLFWRTVCCYNIHALHLAYHDHVLNWFYVFSVIAPWIVLSKFIRKCEQSSEWKRCDLHGMTSSHLCGTWRWLETCNTKQCSCFVTRVFTSTILKHSGSSTFPWQLWITARGSGLVPRWKCSDCTYRWNYYERAMYLWQ